MLNYPIASSSPPFSVSLPLSLAICSSVSHVSPDENLRTIGGVLQLAALLNPLLLVRPLSDTYIHTCARFPDIQEGKATLKKKMPKAAS